MNAPTAVETPRNTTESQLLRLVQETLEQRKWNLTWLHPLPPHNQPIDPRTTHPEVVALVIETSTPDAALTITNISQTTTTHPVTPNTTTTILPFPSTAATYTLSHPPARIAYASLLTASPTYASSTLALDTSFYARLAATAGTPQRRLLASLTIPIRDARAWTVPAGALCRLVAPRGAQVGDLNLWHARNTRERFWAARTRQIHGTHVSTHARLWSNLPYMRPLATIVADSLADYGTDADGGRVHDLLGTRCDPYIRGVLGGGEFDLHCHSNLTRAVAPLGLEETDVHDVINVFQVTGLNREGRYFMKTSPARPGEYFEFFAEVELLCAMSACPGGDLSVFGWDSDEAMKETCHELQVEVWGVEESLLEGWKKAEVAKYTGNHGMERVK